MAVGATAWECAPSCCHCGGILAPKKSTTEERAVHKRGKTAASAENRVSIAVVETAPGLWHADWCAKVRVSVIELGLDSPFVELKCVCHAFSETDALRRPLPIF